MRALEIGPTKNHLRCRAKAGGPAGRTNATGRFRGAEGQSPRMTRPSVRPSDVNEDTTRHGEFPDCSQAHPQEFWQERRSGRDAQPDRTAEYTSELQSLMRR